mmetsp:Transcript_23039/g.41606  ORF Transcript_23039/g.41606 Transcript_23039/m.41606 type:complete len:543 (+) Transcript_23039:104-1732(+)
MCSSGASRGTAAGGYAQGVSPSGCGRLQDRRRSFRPTQDLNLHLDLSLSTLRRTSSKNEVFVGLQEAAQDISLGKFLGAGSMSVVRLASRRRDGRPLAVKIISSTDEELREATRNEFRLMRAASHSAIVRVDALLEMEDGMWICMELCDFGCVESYVRRNGVLKEPDVSRLFNQLLIGVDFLHSKRTVHRDLKPANLLLKGPSLDLKITDFNCAKQVGKSACLMLTERGSHHFSAPELRFGRIWNERIDIWSSGLCLYFMMCGELPFNIMDSQSANFILKTGLIPPCSWTGVPDLLKNLVIQCLTVNSSDRPPAMELLLHPALHQKHRRPSGPIERCSGDEAASGADTNDFVVLKSCGLTAMRGGVRLSRARHQQMSPRSPQANPWMRGSVRRNVKWHAAPDSPGGHSAVSSSAACPGTFSSDTSLTRDEQEEDDMSSRPVGSIWRESRSGVYLLHRLAQNHCERTMGKVLSSTSDEALSRQTSGVDTPVPASPSVPEAVEGNASSQALPSRSSSQHCCHREKRSLQRYFTINGASFVDNDL